MIQVLRSEYQVVVVDPRHADYSHLLDGAMSSDFSLRMLATGRAALRAARELNPDLWIINTELPDMNGTDLYEMLSERLDHVPVVLVANDYCAEKELQVRRVGAPIFACKPLDSDWLRYGVEHRRRQLGYGQPVQGQPGMGGAAASGKVRVAG